MMRQNLCCLFLLICFYRSFSCPPNCTTCDPLFDTVCLSCDSGFFVNENNTCGVCNSSCEVCVEENVCSSCPNGQQFISTGDGNVLCGVSCPVNFSNCTICSPTTSGFTLTDNNFSCGNNPSNNLNYTRQIIVSPNILPPAN